MAFDSIEGGRVDRGTFANFTGSIDPAWIEAGLQATGKATIRRRRFPAEQVVWLVLGMALFRDLPIAEVVKELALVLPGSGAGRIAASAVAQARARLGVEPLRWLFDRCASVWATASAKKHSWRGLNLYGLDGTTVRIPDSRENRKHFGGQTTGGRGNSGYPLVRVVALMVLRSHLLLAARFGPYRLSERKQGRDLLALVPDDSLVLADRGFLYARDLWPLQTNGANRHWLSRARKNSHWRVLKRMRPGDLLVEVLVNHAARQQEPSLPERWRMRAIRYHRRGFRQQTLLTSLLDARQYPAAEIIALYHERWEIELGFDEVKTEMLEREETIRSRKPEGVAQEIWGLLLAYNLVRLEMERAAKVAGVPPTRLSFVACLRVIKISLLRFVFGSPGKLPQRVEAMRRELAEYVLPERRTARLYPRAVKMKMSNYPRKRTAATRERAK